MCQPDQAVVQAVHEIAQTGGYDQITLILTATAVILAALGVIFAIASVVLGAFAVIGYKDFKSMIEKQNAKMMEEFFARYPTPQQIKDDLFSKATGDQNASILAPQASTEGVELPHQVGGTTEAVGKPYPESEAPK